VGTMPFSPYAAVCQGFHSQLKVGATLQARRQECELPHTGGSKSAPDTRFQAAEPVTQYACGQFGNRFHRRTQFPRGARELPLSWSRLGPDFPPTPNRCNYALSEIKSGHLPPPAVGFRRGSVQPNRQDLFVASRSVAAYVREFYSQAPATLHSDKHVHPHRTTNRRLGSRSPML